MDQAMLSGITVLVGGAHSGKTSRMVGHYRQILAADPPGSALWISPTYRHASAVASQLAGQEFAGCLAPHCLTFDQFARRILESSSARIRPLGSALSRQLLSRLVEAGLDGGQLDYFAGIARTRGFLDLLAQFIREFKRLEIWPDELARAWGARASAKDRELNWLYEQYQQLLNQHDLYDAEGRFWSARACCCATDSANRFPRCGTCWSTVLPTSRAPSTRCWNCWPRAAILSPSACRWK